MCYTFQLSQGNSVLCHHYYQGLPNQIQNLISTQKQVKPTLFQNMYALAMTINHCYWECDCKCHCVRQVKKEALESHSQKQEKASTSCSAIASQNKVNLFLVASSVKTFLKSSLSSTFKKQSNTLQVNLSSELASNGKLTSDEYKKCLKNNLCLYYGIRDYKLNFCSKKQVIVTPKSHSASITTDPPAVASKKPSEKQRVTPRTLHRLKATLNFSIQQQVPSNSIHLLFLILIHSLFLLPFP